MSDSVSLGPGREFDVIRDLVRRWGTVARGIGDDAAVIEVPAGSRLVASTDASIENVHFRRAWLRPSEIGYRAAVAALSDLAAMAATPIAMLVAMSVPARWREDVGSIADGIGEAARLFEAAIVGGNLTGGGELALTMTVLGAAAQPLGRDGAKPGDSLYVTGTLGGARGAVRAWESGRIPTPEQRLRFARPTARLREARWLAEHGATAAIDISDGLAADLGHLASASGVEAHIELAAIPVESGVTPYDAAASGEDYEIVVAARGPIDAHAFAAAFGVPLTRIGSLVADTRGGERVRLRSRGTFVDLPPGYDHLSS